jgi:four helix bundle protein
MKLEDLQVYQLSMQIGEDVWNIVIEWSNFEKDTVGKQLVRAIDPVAANLSEGFGRYHFREKTHFSYYSRGSLYESKTWLTKANNRKLIDKEKFEYLLTEIEKIGIKLNNYITSTKKQI